MINVNDSFEGDTEEERATKGCIYVVFFKFTSLSKYEKHDGPKVDIPLN